jgi:hypothetical protein
VGGNIVVLVQIRGVNSHASGYPFFKNNNPDGKIRVKYPHSL